VALAAALPGLDLNVARQFPHSLRQDLDLFIRDSLDKKGLEGLAKMWEPKRKLDQGLKLTLRADLSDLLQSRREVYLVPTLSLAAARSLSMSDREALKRTLDRLSPTADLKKLLSSWDKHFKPAPSARDEQLERLSKLLSGGAEPAPKPVTSRARK
jgi:hypothetical protein